MNIINTNTSTAQFDFHDHPIRTNIDAKGEPWFIAIDVCAALAIKNSRDALSNLDVDEKGVANTDTLGGSQNLTTVNQSGMYELIFRSRKPAAKEFKRWIKQSVLPAIQREGMYVVGEEKLDLEGLPSWEIQKVITDIGERIERASRLKLQALDAKAKQRTVEHYEDKRDRSAVLRSLRRRS